MLENSAGRCAEEISVARKEELWL